MIGLFVVGCFITAIVGAACWLIVTGILEDSHARQELQDEGIDRSVGL